MIAFPEIVIREKDSRYRLVERFLQTPYWAEESRELFSEDITVEYPYAPPGMLQSMIPFEFHAHCLWLRQIVRNWKVGAHTVIIPTTDKAVYWAIREEQADMTLGGREGPYVNECVFRITFEGEKIRSFQEYSNPHAYYRVMGLSLPAFRYACDLAEDPPCVRMGKDEKSKFTREQNLKRAVDNYANPITGNDGDPESIYAHDVVEVIPFAAYDHALVTRGKDFDANIEWMFRNVLDWNTTEKPPFYQSTDPNVIIVESYGYGETTWSKCHGHYMQRELQIAHMNEQGKVDHFRVYFNPVYEYTSTNQSIPTIPYFNY